MFYQSLLSLVLLYPCTIQGIVGSIVEVFAITIFVYLVLPEISPGVGIMLLCGVFFFQIVVDIFKTPNWFCGQNRCSCFNTERNGYDHITGHHNFNLKTIKWAKVFEYFVRCVQVLLENKVTKVLALLLQILGIIGFISLWVSKMKGHGYDMIRPMVGFPLVILVLSFIWTNWFQEKIAEPHTQMNNVTARFKSSKYFRQS